MGFFLGEHLLFIRLFVTMIASFRQKGVFCGTIGSIAVGGSYHFGSGRFGKIVAKTLINTVFPSGFTCFGSGVYTFFVGVEAVGTRVKKGKRQMFFTGCVDTEHRCR